MITLRADNRNQTVRGQYFGFLATNYASGMPEIRLTNSNGFAVDDYILLGEFGHEQSEICQIQAIDSTTHIITLVTVTQFAHVESTRITKLHYNQVRFYWTATATFSGGTPLTGYVDIDADCIYSHYEDSAHTTGFGWFKFYNSTTTNATAESNPIPYASFARDTVAKCIEGALSLIANNERKLLSDEELMEWINEGYDIINDDLGMTTNEFNASVETTQALTSGTSEYALPSDFSEMIAIWADDSGEPINPIDVAFIDERNNNYDTSTLKYYIRGAYLGFSPEITTDQTIKYRYLKTGSALTSYYDTITLPKKGFNILKYFIIHMAKMKLKHPDAASFLELFEAKIGKLRSQVINRDQSLDSFSIDSSANN